MGIGACGDVGAEVAGEGDGEVFATGEGERERELAVSRG